MADLQKSSSNHKTTSVHVTALDSIVSVNGLFTSIVFLGISFSTTATAAISTTCVAGTNILRNLVILEVISFSCFLFSSLTAQGLKLHINLLNSYDAKNSLDARVEKRLLKFGLVASSCGTALGCVFLMLAMVNVVQIRLGRVTCSEVAARVVGVVVVMAASAVVIFSYAVYDATTKVSKERHNNHGHGVESETPCGHELNQIQMHP